MSVKTYICAVIISHRHKFIFIKTVKTAGTSIEIVLSSICGPEDIITRISPKDEEVRNSLGYPGPQNQIVPLYRYNLKDIWNLLRKGRRIRYYNHARAREIKRWIGQDMWDSYYKFSIDRNPYDKVVSLYFWRGGPEKFGNIGNFLRSRKVRKIHGLKYYGIGGELAVDKVYQFEKIPEMLREISNILKLPSPLLELEYKAKGDTSRAKRHYTSVLSNPDYDVITKMFRAEFEYFNYPVESA